MRWRGGLYLLTAGGLGIRLAIDVFTILRQVATANGLRTRSSLTPVTNATSAAQP